MPRQREAQTQAEMVGNSVYTLVQDHATVDVELADVSSEVAAVAAVIASFADVLQVHAERRQHLLSGDEFRWVLPSPVASCPLLASPVLRCCALWRVVCPRAWRPVPFVGSAGGGWCYRGVWGSCGHSALLWALPNCIARPGA
jgi:hypothetical protein